MQKITTAFLFFLTAATVSWSQKNEFQVTEIFPVDAGHSYIGFSIKYMGFAMVRGRFKEFRGAIRFDEKNLTKTSASFSINAASIDTGDKDRDNDLQSAGWFDAKTYPAITFTSKSVEVTAEGMIVKGDLTIHGITKNIAIVMSKPVGVVKDVRGDSQIIFSGSTALDRKEFGVEGKRWDGIKEGITAVSNEVNIELTILGKRINEPNFRNWVNNPESPAGKIYSVAKSDGTAKAINEFETLSKTSKEPLNDRVLNTAGQMLLKENKTEDALALFRKNVDAFPQSSIANEACGEALAKLGNWSESSKYYKRAAELDPGNMKATETLRNIP